MKKEIYLTKQERLLEIFLLFVAGSSFAVLGLAAYLQANDSANDQLLILLYTGSALIFFGLFAYNGFRNGNIVKKWSPPFLFDLAFWALKKAEPNSRSDEATATKAIALLALLFSVLLAATAYKQLMF